MKLILATAVPTILFAVLMVASVNGRLALDAAEFGVATGAWFTVFVTNVVDYASDRERRRTLRRLEHMEGADD